ncbi:MAG: Rossmann-like and DUF2520 domain-containing protein [Planctomycetota bacterium]
MTDIPQPIALIGAGSVGKTLGRRFHELGLRLGGVACRSGASALAATRFIGAGRPADDPDQALAGAALITIAVPDHAIDEVARRLARSPHLSPSAMAFHTSGALGSDALQPLRDRGLATGSLHPLQAFADPAKAVHYLAGITYGIEGDAAILPVLHELVRRLGGCALSLRPDQKVLYHAAAVIASNYTVALAALATFVLRHIGADAASSLQALLPLLDGTVRNLDEVGLPAALTGPIARGDTAVVAAHLRALDAVSAELGAIYRRLGRVAAQIAEEKGTLTAERRRELDGLLS